MTADAPGRVSRRTGQTGAFGTGTYRAPRRTPPRDFGPFDAAELDPDLPDPPSLVDFGAVRVPVPDDGTVSVEPTADGRLQAVHVSLPGGRLSVSALAAPKSSELWPELVAEIDSSLRDGGARVRSFQGEWGRELHARTGAANSVFIGVDGARWMLYGVATGPAQHAVDLEAALREMLRGAVVDRGRSPYPVRTVLPLVVPEHLAGDAVEDTAMSLPVPAPSAPARSALALRAPVAQPDPVVRRPEPAEPQPAATASVPPARPQPPRRVAPPRAVPGRPRAAPAAPRVVAESTQVLPSIPRVAARAAPVRAERPGTAPPLWATSPGPVSAADLGPDPADAIPSGRPVNDVVTPTEWWPVVAAEPVPLLRPAGPAPDPTPAGRSAGYGVAEPAVPVPDRGAPAVEPETPGPPTGRWSYGPDGWTHQPDDPAPDVWASDDPAPYVSGSADRAPERPADVEPGPIERAAAAAVAAASAPPTERWPALDTPDPEDRFRSNGSERNGFGSSGSEQHRDAEAGTPRTGRRRAPEPEEPRRRRQAAEPAPARSGRRRAPEPPAPDGSAPRRNGHRTGPTEVRRADDSLDLAALARSRSGPRRARPEPVPVARTGRRRAPEPSFAEPVTEPLAMVRRRETEMERDGAGPAWAHLAEPSRPAPGRHHRPG